VTRPVPKSDESAKPAKRVITPAAFTQKQNGRLTFVSRGVIEPASSSPARQGLFRWALTSIDVLLRVLPPNRAAGSGQLISAPFGSEISDHPYRARTRREIFVVRFAHRLEPGRVALNECSIDCDIRCALARSLSPDDTMVSYDDEAGQLPKLVGVAQDATDQARDEDPRCGAAANGREFHEPAGRAWPPESCFSDSRTSRSGNAMKWPTTC
jgi:hypothetical protein